MPSYAIFAIAAAALAGTLVGEYRDDARIKWAFKPLTSTCFLVAAWGLGAFESRYGLMIFTGLVLSWFGDVLLIPKGKGTFLAGLVSFLLGHVAYAVAFFALGVDWTLAAIAGGSLLVVGLGFERWLRPQVPAPMRAPVLAYILVITVMVAAAFGAWGAGLTWLAPLGAVAFWASDISVALDRFAGFGFANRLWGLPTYYIAQLILAMTIAIAP